MFIKFDIVDELNLASHKFHHLVYKIWFRISLLFGSKVKFNIRFQSYKSAMNFKFEAEVKVGCYPATKICG